MFFSFVVDLIFIVFFWGDAKAEGRYAGIGEMSVIWAPNVKFTINQ